MKKEKLTKEETTSLDDLAKEIECIQAAVKRLEKGRFNKNALVLLIADACSTGFSGGKYRSKRKPTKAEVLCILSGIEAIKARFFSKQPTTEAKS